MRRVLWLLLGLAACDSGADRQAADHRKALALVQRIEEPGVLDRLVEIGDTAALIHGTTIEDPLRRRLLSSVALGRVGGPGARERLLELLRSNTRDPNFDGPTRLYAAVGLTELEDPGSAVDLILELSKVNTDDYVAGLASEERSEEYYTVDAQICEALLALGLWELEEDLVAQLRRRDRIRVLIDAHAILRRRTGLELPFRYNGSYDDRNADADLWLERLRETRDARRAKRPFDAENTLFGERCGEVMEWLGGQSVALRLKAQKILTRLGPHARPLLEEALAADNPIAQRQAAHMLGRLRFTASAPALRRLLEAADADARAEALTALAGVGDGSGLERVRELLEDRDPEVRAAAAGYLAAFGSEAEQPLLRGALEAEKSPATHTALLCALLRLGDHDAVAPVLKAFVEGEQLEREIALAALEAAAGRSAEIGALAPRKERLEAAGTMEAWFADR